MDTDLVLRDSMCKFPSGCNQLEVIGYSKRLPFYFNRPLISLLNGLGVPHKVFLEIQSQFLGHICSSKLLNKQGYKSSMVVLAKLGHNEPITRKGTSDSSVAEPMINPMMLFKAGFNCNNCEMLYEIMLLLRKLAVAMVRKKARIPLEKAVCAIGFLDKLGVLNPGEIFVQYTDRKTQEITAVKGNVLVGRSPCLDPGYVQQVTAADYPELYHMVDVVVFPRVRQRSLSDSLS